MKIDRRKFNKGKGKVANPDTDKVIFKSVGAPMSVWDELGIKEAKKIANNAILTAFQAKINNK